jgi:hypothetical protein
VIYSVVSGPATISGNVVTLGIETEQPVNVGGFSQGQRAFLDYHRNSVLLRARSDDALSASIEYSRPSNPCHSLGFCVAHASIESAEIPIIMFG